MKTKEELQKIFDDYLKSDKPCPYCWNKDGDPHSDDCYMLDIVAYLEEDVPLPAEAPAAADAAPARADGRELPYERFMEILREVLHFPPDEELFDEWAVIEAIRQDNAIIMTREAETERLQAELAAAREALNVAESTLHSISQRLPMTDSYKDVNMNREELRSLATKYFDTPEARATVARRGAE